MDKRISRRSFLTNIAIGSAGVIILGGYTFIFKKSEGLSGIYAIIIDFDKCTGCRTCETVCSAFNHKVEIDGEMVNGLGNPNLANIRIHHFNPDVDIPNVCQLCPDNPCVKACPITPDIVTGRKALYRDETTFAIINDTERCIGCMECAKACANIRRSVIIPNEKTHKPERMCTLCDSDPQCIKYCPYGALSKVEVDMDSEFFGKSPEEIAKVLIKKYYEIEA